MHRIVPTTPKGVRATGEPRTTYSVTFGGKTICLDLFVGGSNSANPKSLVQRNLRTFIPLCRLVPHRVTAYTDPLKSVDRLTERSPHPPFHAKYEQCFHPLRNLWFILSKFLISFCDTFSVCCCSIVPQETILPTPLYSRSLQMLSLSRIPIGGSM